MRQAMCESRWFRAVYLKLAGGLSLLSIFYLAGITFGSEQNEPLIEIFNTVGPMAYLALMLQAAYALIKKSSITILTPVVGYLLSSALFFGIGPLVYPLGAPETQQYLQGHFLLSITQLELIKTNLLNSVGALSVCCSIFLFSSNKSLRSFVSFDPFRFAKSRKLSTLNIGLFFLGAGALIRFVFVLPYQFGLTSFVLPGVINNLGNLIDLGFTIVAFAISKRKSRRVWKLLFITVFPLHILSTLLEFKKSSLIIAILLPSLGAYAASGKLKRLVVQITVIALAYSLSQPYVHYGRDAIEDVSGSFRQATLQQRFDITKRFFEGDSIDTEIYVEQAGQSGWTRLSYSGPQSFAMNEYDAGRPGNTLDRVWSVFIPRVLWPNKPVGIGPGLAFYQLVTGRDDADARVGITVYADAYWNGGWLGLILLSGLMGLMFLMMSNFSLDCILRKELIFLPAILISIQMALQGTTGFFINKIIGGLPIYIAYIIFIKISLATFFNGSNSK